MVRLKQETRIVDNCRLARHGAFSYLYLLRTVMAPGCRQFAVKIFEACLLLSNANRGISNQLAPQAQFRKCAANAIYNKTAPQPSTAHHATTQPPSNGARSITICNRTAPQPTTAYHSRPGNHQTVLQFTIRQRCSTTEERGSRPQPSTADQSRSRPSNGARSIAIYPCGCCLGVCDLCVCGLGVCCLCVCCLGKRSGRSGRSGRGEAG